MHLLTSSPKWFPYFGNQKRFTPFVMELLRGLGAKPGDTLFETNAGSHAISYAAALELGMHPIANDLGAYSCAIGKALTGDEASIEIAAMGAALIQEYGYNPPENAVVKAGPFCEWVEFIQNLPRVSPDAYTVSRGDLFKTMTRYKGDFIYCDFAWPWRDGTYTEEYEYSSDKLGLLLGDTTPCEFKVASARRILQDVIEYLDVARRNYRFVILSNQSSNYPQPEVIEAHMLACGHKPIIQRRQTVPAEHVDDLGKSEFFTEYQYVFEGY